MCLSNVFSLGVPELKFLDIYPYILHPSILFSSEAVLESLLYKGFPPHPQEDPHPSCTKSVPMNPEPTWPLDVNKLLKAKVCAPAKGRAPPGGQMLSWDIPDYTPIKTGRVFTRLLHYLWNCKGDNQEQLEILTPISVSKKKTTPGIPWHAPSSRHLPNYFLGPNPLSHPNSFTRFTAPSGPGLNPASSRRKSLPHPPWQSWITLYYVLPWCFPLNYNDLITCFYLSIDCKICDGRVAPSPGI